MLTSIRSRSLRPAWLASLALALAGCHASGPPPGAPKQAAAPAEAPSARLYATETDAVVPIAAHDAARGSRLALVTIVVFSDFECPFCTRVEATFDRLREAYSEDELRIVFKNLPLSFHPHARLAADIGQGVLALGGQDAFFRYHEIVFARQQEISPKALRAWAVLAGVDGRALEDGLAEGRWAANVEADVALASRLGISGTPASFVNGVLIEGARPLEHFKELIDAELDKARALRAEGAPPDELYARAARANFVSAEERERARARELAEEAAREAAAAARIVHAIPAGSGPSRGPATAQVTIVTFSDYECTHCKRAEPTLGRVLDEYGDKVRLVWRDYPLSSHSRAVPAAELARAARAQRGDAGFWRVHDLLLASDRLEDEDLERIAREAGLDVRKAMAAVAARAHKRVIDADVDVGDDFGVRGTPQFFINGRRLVGAQPFERFKEIIDEEVLKTDALLRAGTAPEKLYEALTKGGQAPPEPAKGAIAPPAKGAPFLGAANAKVIIQEVADYECPFCRRAEPTLEELLKAYPGKVKIVWRDNPLSMHTRAALAAEAAREAFAQQGSAGFAKMRQLLFDNQRALERADLDAYAASIGLDVARFAKALDERTHKAAVDADVEAARDAEVRGVPAFFIGPYLLTGAQPYIKFRKLVDRVLAEQGR